MLDTKKIATIDKNTDIIIGGVHEADDSINKALVLVNDLRSEYGYSRGTKPNNKVPEKLNWPTYGGEDTDIHNSFIWICHYEKIMLKLDMIEDYLLRGADGTAAATEGVNNVNRAAGLTLTSIIENLENEETAEQGEV